jgi:diguanylate cyclase (GGDEF)-like protein
MMILSEVDALADLHVLGAKIISAFQQPFRLENQDLMVTTSVGMAIYPLDGTDVDTLVKKADIAMYEAKKMGRNTYRLYGEIPDAGLSSDDPGSTRPPSES